jgi:hypothetical protein
MVCRHFNGFSLGNYATHQFFRTPKLREIVSQLDNPIPGLDLNRTWLIESHIFATNLGARIYVERYKFTFLNNQTSVPFITGDQPVINLNTHEDKELKLYYPLTPSVALIFAKDKAASCKTVRQPSSIEVNSTTSKCIAIQSIRFTRMTEATLRNWPQALKIC